MCQFQYVSGQKRSKNEAFPVNVMRSFRWNRLLLKYVGIWPLELSNPHFFFFLLYLLLHCSLTFANLTTYKNDIDEIVGNFTENVLYLMTVTKIIVCRINGRSIRQLLFEIENNFILDKYNTLEQKLVLMKYTKLARYYILMAVTSMTVAVILYYIGGMIPNVKIAFTNSSSSYQLPYKTRTIIDIDDTRIYFGICLYQMLIIPTVILGYVGFDCLFINLAFHITAQFGILSYRITESLDDYNSFHCNIKKLILQHYRLIRQAESLENNFNFVIMQQLMGTTFHLCISGYNVLKGSVNRDGLTLALFFSYAFSVISTLFIYCYIGECLIQESINLSNAFYRCEWYIISPNNLKMIHICMLRMKKPQQLTSGKFSVLSLTTFTDILKTSMGYLSVLRNVI